MEEKRRALNEEEIERVLDEIKEKGWTDAKLLSLVKKDLEFGLTKEEVELYLKDQFSPSQIRKLSLALRKHGVDFTTSIAREELDEQCMQVAIDYYDKGISFADILDGTARIQNAHALREIYERITRDMKEAEDAEPEKEADKSYVERVLVDMKEIVVGINRNAERYESLSEKLREYELDSRVKEELKEKEAVIQKQQEEIEALRKQLREKEEEVTEMRQTVPTQIPVQYVTTFPRGHGGQTVTTVIERSQPKREGLYAVLGKLAYKKKSKQDIIRLVASGDLSKEQLAKIKVAMEKGLTEEQLLCLIHGNVSPEQMEEIIEIAVLENSTK